MQRGYLYKSSFKLPFLGAIYFFITSIYAQPALPPRGVSVQSTQALHFGTFALTGGGDGILSVGTDGYRNAIQNVFLSELTPTAQPAIFEIKLCQGRNVTINYDSTTPLIRIGGGTMTLNIGPAKREGINTTLQNGDTFSLQGNCNFITILRVGGTLHIPSNSLPGIYTGSFEITFNQE
ncbi:DUF4402 domain-containing protein [Flavobacterium ovatum]|uniref:DUF4402 domain-containing protein n=1 Tax=Flavobacterium ovatum TaxID=1928857 RepID=UPI00344DD06B